MKKKIRTKKKKEKKKKEKKKKEKKRSIKKRFITYKGLNGVEKSWYLYVIKKDK